ncbi:ATP-binding cassette domain-containing protein [Streptomyces sp. AJS327]|uniref:ABC transporter transmembrane domain-containing protein n=1 Tax=Streptomyces sp. AJS327 TaxID=2545265 RepID=UPI0015DF6438|nr:ABC transporter transmembrane domain-containing protein [Streptomyces sp. AJS327]MBA0053542.1 ATP-binding cassette domain-containing protein [Streptomyces sp. AJS327]
MTTTPTTQNNQGYPSRNDSETIVGVAKRHRGLLILGVVLGLGGVVASLAQPWAIGQMITAASKEESLSKPITQLVALFLAGAALQSVQAFVIGKAGEDIVFDVRQLLTGRLLRSDLAAYQKHSQGDLLTRAVTDTSLVKIALSQAMAQLVLNSATVVGGIGLMFYLDWKMMLITCAVLGTACLVSVGFARKLRTASYQNREDTGEFGADMQRVLGALPTVKASRAENREMFRIGTLAERARASGVRVNAFNALLTPAVNVGTQASLAVVVGVGMTRVANGTMDMADLTAFIMYLFQLVSPLAMLFMAIGEFVQGRAAMERVDELTNLPQEEQDGTGAKQPALVGSLAQGKGAVEFHQVRFGYAAEVGEKQEALSGVSFRVPTRGLTAVVGPSGAGKSTLFNLIERLYKLDGGSILLGGQNIEALPLDTVRGLVGYVQQDSAAMRGTIRENLTYANPYAGEADILDAVEMAGLRDVVAALPNGLDTELGDNGAGMSGGQRQRLCIARTLLQKPAVMLLDEATSNLDTKTEEEFREVIKRVSERCAVVAIAHRISTVVDADKIVVMEDGKVRATGVHQDLMEHDELYARLAGSQLHSESGLIGEPVIPMPRQDEYYGYAQPNPYAQPTGYAQPNPYAQQHNPYAQPQPAGYAPQPGQSATGSFGPAPVPFGEFIPRSAAVSESTVTIRVGRDGRQESHETSSV